MKNVPWKNPKAEAEMKSALGRVVCIFDSSKTTNQPATCELVGVCVIGAGRQLKSMSYRT